MTSVFAAFGEDGMGKVRTRPQAANGFATLHMLPAEPNIRRGESWGNDPTSFYAHMGGKHTGSCVSRCHAECASHGLTKAVIEDGAQSEAPAVAAEGCFQRKGERYLAGELASCVS